MRVCRDHPDKKPVKISAIDSSSFRPTSPKIVVSGVSAARNIPTVVRWSFLFFVFTIPFETLAHVVGLGFLASSLSLSKVSGLLFFVCYFYSECNPHHGRSLPRIPQAMWGFLGYIMIYALNGFFIPDEAIRGFISRLFSLIQLVVIFWISSSLFEDEKLARNAMLTFSVACAILTLGMVLQLPGFALTVAKGDVERSRALGYTSNKLGILLALAAVTAFGLRLNTSFRHFMSKMLLTALTLLLLIGVAKTASRTAVGALMIGFMVYLLPYWRSHRKMTSIIFAIVGIATMAYIIINNPSALARWQNTYEEGHVSGRDKIFPAAVAMILERPIVGWQPFAFNRELARRTPSRTGSKDAHSLYLHLFMEVGAIGTIPFLVGLWWCGRAAWKARKGNLGLLPLALLLLTLASNAALTGLLRKPLWLILALTLGGASIAVRGQKQRRRMLLVRRPLRSGTSSISKASAKSA